MAHILSAEDDAPATQAFLRVLRACGHTVDEAPRGLNGMRLAQAKSYDVVITNYLRPEANHGPTEFPVRASGLPVSVLERHGANVPREELGRWDFVADDYYFLDRRLATAEAAIAVAWSRAKRRALSVYAPGRGSPPRAPGHAELGPVGSIGPSSEAEQRDAWAHWTSRVRVEDRPYVRARWFPGPLAACLHMLDQPGGIASVVGAGGLLQGVPCTEERRERPAVSPGDPRGGATAGSLAPTWATLERPALRERLILERNEAEPALDALLAMAHRGVTPAHPGEDAPLVGTAVSSGVSVLWAEPRASLAQVWWWLLEDGTVVVGDRPVRFALERGLVPHSTTGPAIEYADGFQVHALHGSRVRAGIIEHPDRITVDDIRGCLDAEVRRTLRGMYGDERFFADTLARVVDVDTVPVDALAPGARSITRALVENEEGHRFLVASDGSTSRVYHMRVPRSCRTCAEAYVALSGRPGVRTILEA